MGEKFRSILSTYRLAVTSSLLLLALGGMILLDAQDTVWFVGGLLVLAVGALGAGIFSLRRRPGVLGPLAENRWQEQPEGDYLKAQLSASIPMEQFTEALEDWSESRGKRQQWGTGGGKVQWGIQTGKGSWLFLGILHVGVFFILLGVFGQLIWGYEVTTSVEEGTEATYVEKIKGRVPANWKLFERNGQGVPGYYVPDFHFQVPKFEVTFREGHPHPVSFQSNVRIYSDGEEKDGVIGPLDVFRHGGMEIRNVGYASTLVTGVTLVVTDAQKKVSERLSLIPLNVSQEFRGAKFKILGTENQGEPLGEAIQIEYTEKGKSTEKFWIFPKFPEYDEAHRPESGFFFQAEEIRHRYRPVFQISRNPLHWFFVLGTLFTFVGTFFAILMPHRRFWFSWSETSVEIFGFSDRKLFFEKEFERGLKELKRNLMDLDSKYKQLGIEVVRGHF